MECTIEVTAELTIVVDGVSHPTHAINRVRKYLRENSFSINRDRNHRGYLPSEAISIRFNEMEVARSLTEDDVVLPVMWFDQSEITNINRTLRRQGVSMATINKVNKLIQDNNPL